MFELKQKTNHQNDRKWLTSEENLENEFVFHQEKFPRKIHVYGGVSARGLTKLVLMEGKF